MIQLKNVFGQYLDLSVSPKFIQHFQNGNSYARYIIEKEINPGQWYDELLAKLPNDALIVDLGMNVGMFTLYLNGPDRKFICVEPTGSHIDIAKELFEKFQVKNTIWEGVIYNHDGDERLFSDNSNSTMNRVGDAGWLVKSRTLKSLFDVCRLEKVDLLKIDCEGAEQKIILEDTTVDEPLKKCQVVFIETHDGMDGMKVDIPAIIFKMQCLGFSHTPGKREMSHYFVQLDQRV